jgi:Family of unknown function (DUF5954)
MGCRGWDAISVAVRQAVCMAGDEGGVLGGSAWPGDGDVMAALTRQDAADALLAYPVAVPTGPVFAVVERVPAGWQVLRTGEYTPQAGRDTLGALLRQDAARLGHGPAGETSPQRAELLGAAALLNTERHDELRVAGRRLRVARVEEFVRLGPSGPEPPRPSDGDAQQPGNGYRGRDPAHGFTIVAEMPGSPALLGERFDGLPARGNVAADVWEQAHWALLTHPMVAVLPARFAVSEIKPSGAWSMMSGASTSPQAARDALATYFTHFGPDTAADDQATAAYAAAARLLEHQRPVGLTVAGRRFQVIRVEQVMRLCEDGPEPPRPSDYDPDPPVEAEPGDDYDPDPPVEAEPGDQDAPT